MTMDTPLKALQPPCHHTYNIQMPEYLASLAALALQKAQKKMLDVINSVGLGESVLKMIERRHRADLYLALGGMVSVVLETVVYARLRYMSALCA